MSFQVKVMRKLLRKPYGIVYFKVGRTLYPKVMNLGKDTLTVGEAFFMMNRDKIVVETENIKKTYDLTKYITWREGFPVIFFDVNDCIPLRFENEPGDNRKHPAAIQAILKKEIQAAEAEIMRKQRSTLQKLITVTLALAALNFIFTGLVWGDVGKILTHFAIK